MCLARQTPPVLNLKPGKKGARAGRKPSRAIAKTNPETDLPALQIASDLGAIFGAAVSEVWDLHQIQSFITKKARTILQARGVPADQVQSPRLDITVPAIETMRYCPLRNEMTALIAASMDKRSAHLVHPSFIEILRQLTVDELAILMGMPSSQEVIPVGHIHEMRGRGRTRVLHRNVIPVRLARRCDMAMSIPSYIDNLSRLELVAVPTGLKISDNRPYKGLLKNKFCQKYFEDQSTAPKYQLERSLLALTDLGERFRNACLRQG